MPTSFGAKVEKSFSRHGQLCVGIDPHPEIMSDWGLSDTVEGLRDFSMRVFEAAEGLVGIVKPQVAFFERFGSEGFAALEAVAVAAQKSGFVVIMDAKRGDIGTTMTGYFDAWLGKAAPFVCDALTVSPFLGVESLGNVMSDSIDRGKGLFVLAATSNSEAKEMQRAKIGGATVAADILRQLDEINAVNLSAGSKLGSFGAVVGATVNFSATGLADLLSDDRATTPILAPGFGAQGALLSDAGDLFQARSNRVIASVSRSVVASGPSGVSSAIERAKADLAKGLVNA